MVGAGRGENSWRGTSVLVSRIGHVVGHCKALQGGCKRSGQPKGHIREMPMWTGMPKGHRNDMPVLWPAKEGHGWERAHLPSR